MVCVMLVLYLTVPTTAARQGHGESIWYQHLVGIADIIVHGYADMLVQKIITCTLPVSLL